MLHVFPLCVSLGSGLPSRVTRPPSLGYEYLPGSIIRRFSLSFSSRLDRISSREMLFFAYGRLWCLFIHRIAVSNSFWHNVSPLVVIDRNFYFRVISHLKIDIETNRCGLANFREACGKMSRCRRDNELEKFSRRS